jgi:uncharacterized protein (TIGR02001 family)
MEWAVVRCAWMRRMGSVGWLLYVAASQADGLGGAVGAASDQVLRGLTESYHQVSWQGDLHYAQRGWVGGVSAYGVRRGQDDSASVGLTAYAGFQQPLGQDWQASVMLRHYDYPGYSRRNTYNYDEAAVMASWRERIFASVTASPDTYAFSYYGGFGRGRAFTYEFSARQPLPWWQLSADAGGGYDDLHRQIDLGYFYWSAGISKQWRSFNLDLRYIGTDERARENFQVLATNRLVFSALWMF